MTAVPTRGRSRPPPAISRTASPPPDAKPTPAMANRNSRDSRDSLGSDASASSAASATSASDSSSSTASFSFPVESLSAASANRNSSSNRLSMISVGTAASDRSGQSPWARRRGYMRPQGTDFAASARSRESVLSLGSIAHLQHYFARTGLLDLKGQLARRRQAKARTLDLSQLEAASLYSSASSPSSPYLSPPQLSPVWPAPRSVSLMGRRTPVPELSLSSGGTRTASGPPVMIGGLLVESPVQDHQAGGDRDWYDDDLLDGGGDDDLGDDYDEPEMLPPTVSTYMNREKPLPKPPSLAELKADLRSSLDKAVQALAEAQAESRSRGSISGGSNSKRKNTVSLASSSPSPAVLAPSSPSPAVLAPSSPSPAVLVPSSPSPAVLAPSSPSLAVLAPSSPSPSSPSPSPSHPPSPAPLPQTWYEIQGMHILDVMTLAIRAAKVYYTSHEHPDRLDTIKPEKEVRSELLSVMDMLKRMATRNFAGGLRDDERRVMHDWIAGLYAMLQAEEALDAADRAERAGWSWLDDGAWGDAADKAAAYRREHAFLQSMLAGAPDDAFAGHSLGALPPWEPMERGGVEEEAGPSAPASAPSASAPSASAPAPAPAPAPTPFLAHMQNGLRLVQLHNCAVLKSRRRFGAIPSFHADTQKPYRAADNLRYWVKAAELRWEVLLKIDALGVVCNSRPQVWADFEDAILQWCRTVRLEIAAELRAEAQQASASVPKDQI